MRPTAAAAVAVLTLSLAACVPAGRRLTLVYLHSGRPAAGLAVSAHAGAPALHASRDGTITVPPASATLRVSDPEAGGVVLYEGGIPADGVVRVAEAIRLSGSIAGGGDGVRVRIGDGPREHCLERAYRALGRSAPPSISTSAAGVPLPPSPPRWHTASVDGTAFESGWIAASTEPQLVAFDAGGRVAVRDVVLPGNLLPRATIDTGQTVLETRAGLDVDVTLPRGDLPVALELHLNEAVLDPGAGEDVGRYLSALDQIDPRLFRWIVIKGGLTLSHAGQARLRALPPFASVTVVLREPHSGASTTRTAVLTRGATSSLRLAFDDFGRRTEQTRTFRGRVVLEVGKKPLARATVVVSDFPNRRETVTDFEGRFHVDGIRADRPVTVFVDASRRRARDGHALSQVFRRVSPTEERDFALPPVLTSGFKPTPPPMVSALTPLEPALEIGNGVVLPYKDGCTVEDQYGSNTSWMVLREDATPFRLWAVTDFAPPNQLRFIGCETGTFDALWAASPFAVFHGRFTLDQPADRCPDFCECFTNAIPAVMDFPAGVELSLRFMLGSQPADNLTVWFAPPDFFGDYEPADLRTDNDGFIPLCNVNVRTISLFIQARRQQGGLQCRFETGTCPVIDFENPDPACGCELVR